MTPYDDLKARAKAAIDKDDWATLRGLFVDASAVPAALPSSPYPGGAHTQDSGDNSPPPVKPPVN